MADKLVHIDDEERRTIEKELISKSQALGLDAWESQGNDVQTGLKHLLGMCADCKGLNYCKTEFGNVHAVCRDFDIRLTGKNRITECNLFSPKNVLSLQEMYSIAYLIDVDRNKKVKGFIDTNDKPGFVKKVSK